MFKVGDKVICIDTYMDPDNHDLGICASLENLGILTIRKVDTFSSHEPYLLFEEMPDDHTGYYARRFRAYKKTNSERMKERRKQLCNSK